MNQTIESKNKRLSWKLSTRCSNQGRSSRRALGRDRRRGHPSVVQERPTNVRGQVSRVNAGFCKLHWLARDTGYGQPG